MNLQQLRSVQEVARRGMNVTLAARRLNTSQPAVTKHIQNLEQNLGVQLFVRDRRRLVGLSDAGEALMPLVEQTLDTLHTLRSRAAELAGPDRDITIATVHTHGRSILPPAMRALKQRYPKARVRLLHGARRQVAEWVQSGEADFSIAPMPSEPFPDLDFIACHEVHIVALCPKGHELTRGDEVTLTDLADFPIITYDENFSSRREIDRPFREQSLPMNVFLTTTHADIIKQYVASGFGIGLVAHTVYDEAHDSDLVSVDVSHLFRSSVVHLGIRRNSNMTAAGTYLARKVAPRLRVIS